MTGATAKPTSDGSSIGAAAGSSDPLSCQGVTVRFGGLVAVSKVDLTVPPATIVGLVGPNGAGKSTLFGVLSGLLRPTQGRVLLDGQDVTDTRPQTRAARGLARTFQHPELFTGLTIRDHLVLAHRAKHSKRRIWADAFTMGSLRPGAQTEQESVDELIDMLGLRPVADRSAMGLPLGIARLVELGRALAVSPRVLLLDEPSSGLDSAESGQFEVVLRRVAEERGSSVLLVEHDVELVMRLSSTVYVLDFGALLASGSPSDRLEPCSIGWTARSRRSLPTVLTIRTASIARSPCVIPRRPSSCHHVPAPCRVKQRRRRPRCETVTCRSSPNAAAWLGRRLPAITGVPWWRPISAASNGLSVMGCDPTPIGVEQPRSRLPSAH